LLAGTVAANDACKTILRQSQTELHNLTELVENRRPLDHIWLFAIADRANICLSFDNKYSASARMLQRIEFGEVDVLSGASKTAERERFAQFTLPYRNEATLFYVMKNRVAEFSRYKTLDDFVNAGHTLISMRSSYLGSEFGALRESLLKSDRLIEITMDDQYFSLLRLRRADVAVATDQLLGTLPRYAPDVQPLPTPLHIAPVHLMLSKKTVSQHDMQQLNTAIQSLVAEKFDPAKLIEKQIKKTKP